MGYKQYCKDYENIENYEKAKADNFKGWDVHHRLETHNLDGERRDVDIMAAELQALDMYYNRPASELIFLRKGEHTSLRKVSDSTRKKLSTANKGEKNPMYGKKHSDETLRKMREAKKNISKETKNKLREAHKGKHHSEETRNKIGAANKGKNIWTRGRHWYNNGKENKYCYECPDGFTPGRLI